MPRIYTGTSDPIDFCRRCFPATEDAARARYGEGEGPDGRGNCFGYDCDHPPYGENADRCHRCNKRLGEIDD